MYHHWFYWSEVICKTDSHRPRPSTRFCLTRLFKHSVRKKHSDGERECVSKTWGRTSSWRRDTPQCTPPPFVHCYGSNKSIMHQWQKRGVACTLPEALWGSEDHSPLCTSIPTWETRTFRHAALLTLLFTSSQKGGMTRPDVSRTFFLFSQDGPWAG